MKRLAIFDFDGTLINIDSLFLYSKFSRGIFYLICSCIKISFDLLLWKLKIKDNGIVKEKLLKLLIDKQPLSEFEIKCNRFSQILNSYENSKVVNAMLHHLNSGDNVVIVSASPTNWVRAWASQKGDIKVIGTDLKVQDDSTIDGTFLTKNCYGVEKVNRLKQQYDLDQFDEIFVYGDSTGDIPLMKIADKSFWVKKGKVTEIQN